MKILLKKGANRKKYIEKNELDNSENVLQIII